MKIFILFSIFFSFCHFAFADYTVKIDNFSTILKSNQINKIDFVNYEQLIKTFAPKLIYTKKNYNLSSENFLIAVNPQNFYVLLRSDTIEHIIQLSIPPIEINGNLQIPIQSFVKNLSLALNFSCDFVGNSIFIERNQNFIDFFEPKKKIEVKITKEKKIFEEKSNSKELPSTVEQNEEKIIFENHSDKKNDAILPEKISEKPDIPLISPIKNATVQKKIIEKIDETKKENFYEKQNIKIENLFSTKIEKPTISSLDFDKENIKIGKSFFDNDDFFHNSNNLFREKNTDLEMNENAEMFENIGVIENKSLPPFRKYSIPLILKKRKLGDLLNK